MFTQFFVPTEQQIADQKKRKLKEKERKVDWWELRKAPDTEFKVRIIRFDDLNPSFNSRPLTQIRPGSSCPIPWTSRGNMKRI